MTDLTLPLALVVSCGLNVVFYVLWREADRKRVTADIWYEQMRKAATEWEQRYRDTDAALHAKVAAEVRGGDGEGPVAA